jgi:hypothetical protein
VARGLVADGAFTPVGRDLREVIEVKKDAQCAAMTEALGPDGLDSLVDLLTPWGPAVRDAGGYPPQGPQDLAPSR